MLTFCVSINLMVDFDFLVHALYAVTRFLAFITASFRVSRVKAFSSAPYRIVKITFAYVVVRAR